MVVALSLFLISFGARVVIGLLFGEPIYPDAYYYSLVARSLAAGEGFELDYIWNFVDVGGRLPAEGTLPIPSNGHWMPLAALVQVPFIWLLGPTAFASAVPFWIIAAAVAPLTYVIGLDAGMARWQAAAAGLLVVIPGWVAPYLGQTDNFSVFMLLGALALWLCARGSRGDRRSFALGGIVVGLAFLSRNDGVLLGVPYALAFGWDVLRRPRGSRIGWWAGVACLLGFVVIVAPWLWRQLEVFGSVSPSSASGRILFIRDYRELYSVSSEATLSSFLSQGIGPLLLSRLDGLRAAVVGFATGPLVIVLTPLLVIGAWRHRRDRAFIPWLVYAAALFAFAALVSAVHVPYGTFMHSAVALVPHAYLLSLLGLAALVRWVAARRTSWDAPRATRVFSAMLVGVCLVVASVGTVLTTKGWHAQRDNRVAVLETLAAEADRGDVVMSPDPGAYRYFGGWRGVVTPEDPLPVIEETLRRYGVRWLVLERDHMVRSLAPVLTGDEHPAWLSDPLVVTRPEPPEETDAAEGTDTPDRPDATRVAAAAGADRPGATDVVDGAPEVEDVTPETALYAVCLSAADPRCGGRAGG